MQNYSGVIFGAVMGFTLGVAGIQFTQVEFYIVLVPAVLAFTFLPRAA